MDAFQTPAPPPGFKPITAAPPPPAGFKPVSGAVPTPPPGFKPLAVSATSSPPPGFAAAPTPSPTALPPASTPFPASTFDYDVSNQPTVRSIDNYIQAAEPDTTLSQVAKSLYNQGASLAAGGAKAIAGLKGFIADAIPARSGGFVSRGVSAPPKTVAAQQIRSDIDELAQQEADAQANVNNPPLEFAAGAVRAAAPPIVGSLAGPAGLVAGAGVVGLDTTGTAYADGNTPGQAAVKGALNAGASLLPGAGAGRSIVTKVGVDAMMGAGQDLAIQGVDRVVDGKPIDLGQTAKATLGAAGIGAAVHGIAAAGHRGTIDANSRHPAQERFLENGAGGNEPAGNTGSRPAVSENVRPVDEGVSGVVGQEGTPAVAQSRNVDVIPQPPPGFVRDSFDEANARIAFESQVRQTEPARSVPPPPPGFVRDTLDRANANLAFESQKRQAADAASRTAVSSGREGLRTEIDQQNSPLDSTKQPQSATGQNPPAGLGSPSQPKAVSVRPSDTPVSPQSTTESGDAKAKEPWEMTREEYVASKRKKIADENPKNPSLQSAAKGERLGREFAIAHRTRVDEALSAGRPVPPEVLKDYPDLSPPTAASGDRERIREDSPEAAPIRNRIDVITAEADRRHAEMQAGQVRDLTHPFDLLTAKEKTELHDLKMRLRPKSREEARADILKKRAERKASGAASPRQRGSINERLGLDKLRSELHTQLEQGGHPRSADLERFRGEAWADTILESRKPRTPAAENSLTARRDEAERQLRDTVAKHLGPEEILHGKSDALKSQIMRGDVSPGSAVPLEDAIRHAESLPEDHPARLALHNLRELEKNPAGVDIVKVNTNDLPDGTRVQVNDKETFTVDKEMGVVKDGITSNIPEEGIDLYGQRVLKPVEPDGPIGKVEIDADTPDIVFEAEKRASSGKLDDLEAWAKAKLGESRKRKAKAFSELTPQQRRRKGSAEGPFDPNELPYHAAILAAKIGKATVKFAQWSRDMLAEFGKSVRPHLSEIWRQGRKLSKMDNETRAAWVLSKVHTPATETPKEAIRRSTGLQSVSKAVTEVKALQASLRARARGAREGYRAGVEDERASQKNIAATAQQSKSATIPLSRAIRAQMEVSSKAETRGAKAGWQAAIEEGSGIRDELTRIIKENVPLADRGRLLTHVASAQTLADLNRAVVRVNEVLRAREHSNLVEEYQSLAKAVDPDQLKPEFRDRLNKVIGDISPKGISDARESRLQRMVEYADNNPDHFIPPNILDAARAALRKKSVRDMSSDEIRAVNDFIKSIKHLNDTFNRLRVNGIVRERALLIGRAEEKLRVVPDLAPGPGDVTDTAGKAIETLEPNRVRRAMQRRQNPDAATYQLDGGDPNGPFREILYDSPRRGRDEAHRLRFESRDRVNEAIKAAGLKGWGSKALQRFSAEVVETPLPDGSPLAMTRGQRIDLAAGLLDRETRAKMTDGGIKRKGAQYDRDAYKIDEAWARKFLSGLDPRESQLVTALRAEFNGGMKKKMNAVFVRLSGFEQLKRSDYWPSNADRPPIEEPAGDVGTATRRYLENMGIFKERVNHRLPMVVENAFDRYDRNLWAGANFVGNAENLHSAWQVLGTPELQRTFVRKYGQVRLKQMKDFILNAAMNDDTPPSGWVSRVAGRAARYVLATPTAAIKQLSGIPTLMADLGTDAVARASAKIAANPKLLVSTWDDLKQSGIMRSRYQSDPVGMVSPQLEPNRASHGRPGFLEAVRDEPMRLLNPIELAKLVNEHGLDPMQAMDYVNAVVAYHATDPSLPVPERAYRASEAIARTQNASDPIDFSGSQLLGKKDSITRMANMFGSQSNSVYNLLSRLRTEYRFSNGASKKARIAGAMALTVISQAVVSNLLARKLKNVMYGADQDEAKAQRSFGMDIAQDAASIFTGPLMAGFGRTVVDAFTGGGLNTDRINVLPTRALQSVPEAVQSIVTAIAATAKRDPKAIERWVQAVDRTADSTGMLTGQAWINLVRMLGRITKGQITDPVQKDGGGYATSDARTLIKRNIDVGDTAGAAAVFDKNRIGLPNLARMIENAEPEDAVKLWAAGTAADRESSRQAMEDRIAGSTRLPLDQKRRLFAEAKIAPPESLEFKDELSRLRKAKDAVDQRDKEAQELIQEAATIARDGNLDQARAMRLDAAQRRRDAKMSPQDAARLERLESIAKNIATVEKQIKSGALSKEVGQRRISTMLKLAADRKAA